jgi:hypothetical protein
MRRKSFRVAVLVASGAIGCGGVTTLEPGDATFNNSFVHDAVSVR